MQILAAHHAAVTVSDMKRSLDFYTRVLGFDFLLEREITTPWVATVNGYESIVLRVGWLQGHGINLELLQFASPAGEPLALAPNRPGNMHLAFLVDDMDAALAHLHANDVELVSLPETNSEGPNGGSRCMFFFDPDGIRVEFLQAPAGRVQFPPVPPRPALPIAG